MIYSQEQFTIHLERAIKTDMLSYNIVNTKERTLICTWFLNRINGNMNQCGGVIRCHHCVCFLEDDILEQVLMALCLASNKELFSTKKERHLLYKPNRKIARVFRYLY